MIPVFELKSKIIFRLTFAWMQPAEHPSDYGCRNEILEKFLLRKRSIIFFVIKKSIQIDFLC